MVVFIIVVAAVCGFLKTGFYCVAQAILELTEICLLLPPRAGIKGMATMLGGPCIFNLQRVK